jgi:hypothetical protein
MTSIKDKVRKALKETHILVLGSQIVLGFKFQSVFQPGFERLAPQGRWLIAVSLGLLLTTFLQLVLPTSYHRIAEAGNDTRIVHRVTSLAATVALPPLAIALGLDFSVALGRIFGVGVAVAIGLCVGAMALLLWHGPRFLLKSGGSVPMQNYPPAEEQTSLKDRVSQLLTEARIILPGAQALLGFQLAAYFTDSFERLPPDSQVVHTASALCIALVVALLMTPAAYHRLVDQGEDTPDFERFSVCAIIGALLPLALGLAGESYVLLIRVSQDPTLAAVCGIGIAAALIGVWYILPLAVRLQRAQRRAMPAGHRG